MVQKKRNQTISECRVAKIFQISKTDAILWSLYIAEYTWPVIVHAVVILTCFWWFVLFCLGSLRTVTSKLLTSVANKNWMQNAADSLSSLFLGLSFGLTFCTVLDLLHEDKIRIPKCNNWPTAFSMSVYSCVFHLQACTTRLSKENWAEGFIKALIRFALSKQRGVGVRGRIVKVPHRWCFFNGQVSGQKCQKCRCLVGALNSTGT